MNTITESMMAFSDALILEAITKLSASGEPFTYSHIIKEMRLQCSLKTIQRSVARLERAGAIVRIEGCKKQGYTYAVRTAAYA